MFTGIVQAVGSVLTLEPSGNECGLRIHAGGLDLTTVAVGDSIAVDGVCVTATAVDDTGFRTHVSTETLARTTLGRVDAGTAVNLEKALTLSSPLGGHLVSGHVDGTGVVHARTDGAQSLWLDLEAPAPLGRFIAEKGSICVNGVSLTVNGVSGSRFHVTLVPHTLQATTLGRLLPGDRVNLEVDIIARYLERLLLARHGAGEAAVKSQ